MGLTSLPTRGVGQPLGPVKVDDVDALQTSEWNAMAQAIEEIAQSLGLSSGSIAATIEEDRVHGGWPTRDFPSYGKIMRVANIEDFVYTANALRDYGQVTSGADAAIAGTSPGGNTVGRIGAAYVRASAVGSYAQFFTGPWSLSIGAGRFRYETSWYVSNVPPGGEGYRLFSGLADANVDTYGANAIGFRYETGVNGGKLQFVTRSANVETVIDTGRALDGNFFDCAFEVNGNGTQVQAWLGGVLVAIVSTTIPTGTSKPLFLVPGAFYKTAGTTLYSMFVDYAAWSLEPTTPL